VQDTLASIIFSSSCGTKDGNEMDVTIHGDDWSKTFYWPDALPAAKPPIEMTHYQHACGQWVSSARVWAMGWMRKYR